MDEDRETHQYGSTDKNREELDGIEIIFIRTHFQAVKILAISAVSFSRFGFAFFMTSFSFYRRVHSS